MNSDITRVRQIVFNLVSNACKFTENGSVNISAKKELLDSEEFLKIEVRDTGIGMTEEQMDKLFSSFTQADSSTTRKYGGTIGPFYLQTACEYDGRRADGNERVGLGSTFTALLPTDSRGIVKTRRYQKLL